MKQMTKLLDKAANKYEELMKALPLHVARHLTSREFERNALKRFDQIDVNDDGALSSAELKPVLCDLGDVQAWSVSDEHLEGFSQTRIASVHGGDGGGERSRRRRR